MRNIFVIPVMLNFETSNGRIMPKLNFYFKQRKFFCLLPTDKSFKTFRLFFQLNLLVGSNLIERKHHCSSGKSFLYSHNTLYSLIVLCTHFLSKQFNSLTMLLKFNCPVGSN